MTFRLLFASTALTLIFLTSFAWAAPQSPHLIKVREALSMRAEADELKQLIPLVEKNDIRTVEFLVYELPRHLNPAVRGHIARVLKHVGEDPDTGRVPDPVINVLVEALEDSTLYRDPTEPIVCGKGVINSEWSVQAEAAESLGVLRASTVQAIEKLTEIATVTEPNRLRARLAAIVSLGQIGPAAAGSAAVVAEVLKAKEEQHIRLRQAAVKTLGQLGPGAAPELPALVPLLDDDRERVSAIYAIGGMREGARELVPQFIKSVHHRADGAHYAEALSQMGEVVHPFLREEIKSADPERRDRALTVLAHMGKEAVFAIDEIKTHLFDNNVQTRQKVIATLLRMEALAAPAQAELEESLNDEDEQVRSLAMVGLLMISAKNPLALRRLEQLAESPENMDVVAWAVKYAGAEALSIIPSLESAMQAADNEFQKLKAAQTLMSIDRNSKPGCDVIRRALRHSSHDVRMQAFSICRGLGKNAEPLLDDLRTLKDLDQFEQKQVFKAIDSIENAN